MGIVIAAWLALAAGEDLRPDFALRDGDTVVFVGDSITAARTYGKIVENYTLLRFPGRKMRFVNAGWGGDTAAGGLARLDRDVWPHQPTVLIVAYGTNDIGWGVLADEPHRARYLAAVRSIVAACKKRGARVYLCSAAVTAADPATSEDSFLQKMCDAGMELARAGGGQSIDVQRSMREVQKRVAAHNAKVKGDKDRATLHAADGVHLNDLGQLAMASAILKGLNAPALVSSVHLDAREPRVASAEGCTVTDLARDGSGLAFTRQDEGLPFNNGLFYPLHYRFVPVHDELARYTLGVQGLPEGKYTLTADGRPLGTYTSEALSRGVNLAFATADAWQPGGPWDAQATVLKSLTDARHELAIAGLMGRTFLPGGVGQELAPGAKRTDEELVALQRLAAKPRPYRFVIRPAEEQPPKP